MSAAGRADAVRIGSKVSGLPGHSHDISTVSTFGLSYDTVLTMADPGSGKVRTDAAAGAPATNIALSKIIALGVDCSALVSQLLVGDQVYVRQTDTATNWARFVVRAAVTYTASAWFLIPVTTVAMRGAIGSNKAVLVEISHWSVQSPA